MTEAWFAKRYEEMQARHAAEMEQCMANAVRGGMMDERMHKIWRYLDQISDASRNARELMQQIWGKDLDVPRKSYWEEGQRLRSKLGGQMGKLVFVDGHPSVRRDGDSYTSALITSEWEPV